MFLMWLLLVVLAVVELVQTAVEPVVVLVVI
jgi:hypothetical protein